MLNIKTNAANLREPVSPIYLKKTFSAQVLFSKNCIVVYKLGLEQWYAEIIRRISIAFALERGLLYFIDSHLRGKTSKSIVFDICLLGLIA